VVFPGSEDTLYGSWRKQLELVAAERGVVIEEHWLGAGGKNGKAVFRALRHRDIAGLLLAPPGLTSEPVEIALPPGHSFQVVTFGPVQWKPRSVSFVS